MAMTGTSPHVPPARGPKATVAGIVTDDSRPGEILLMLRNGPPFEGQWCLPGGHIEPYEAAHAAAIREVGEETGLRFDARFLRYFDEIIPERGIHAVVIVFEGCGTGTLVPQEAEVAALRWFSLEEARSLPLAFAHNDILDAYAEEAAQSPQRGNGDTRREEQGPMSANDDS
jgi:8-oxo-dGTP diphosphatase